MYCDPAGKAEVARFAKSVLVLKRGKGKGFSGVENDLFVDPKTSMLFGDARQSLLDLGLQVKEA